MRLPPNLLVCVAVEQLKGGLDAVLVAAGAAVADGVQSLRRVKYQGHRGRRCTGCGDDSAKQRSSGAFASASVRNGEFRGAKVCTTGSLLGHSCNRRRHTK